MHQRSSAGRDWKRLASIRTPPPSLISSSPCIPSFVRSFLPSQSRPGLYRSKGYTFFFCPRAQLLSSSGQFPQMSLPKGALPPFEMTFAGESICSWTNDFGNLFYYYFFLYTFLYWFSYFYLICHSGLDSAVGSARVS